MSYDLTKHHRRSIRLKGHDYAGGGLYFVTICAHREFMRWGKGSPFVGAACVSPVPGIMEEKSAFAPGVRQALEDNRLLILEMRDTAGNLVAAESRNRFVIEKADTLFTPYVAKGGMLERLLDARDSITET